MKKNKRVFRWLVLSFLLFISVFAPSASGEFRNVESEPRPKPSPTALPSPVEDFDSSIPKANWEPIFFESINERTKLAKVQKLRDSPLDKKDIEVRIWGGFGLSSLDGFRLVRTNNEWAAFRFDQVFSARNRSEYRTIKLGKPKKGWELLWTKLVDEGLLTLPDAESINCLARVFDGYSYVVEIKKGDKYRTYMYDNPDYPRKGRCRQTEQIVRIAKLIDEQFSLSRHRK